MFCPRCGKPRQAAEPVHPNVQPQPAIIPQQPDQKPQQQENEISAATPGDGNAGQSSVVTPPVKKKGIAAKILGLVISLGLIIGGFSGELVLIGTNSSTALIVAGFIFLIIDIISIIMHVKNDPQEAISDKPAPPEDQSTTE